MTYLLQGELLLRSHACHGVDHGGGQGGAGHHRVVGHRRHWRLRQRRLAVVRRLLVPLGCCRVRHVWNRVLGGELEVGVHLLQLLQLVFEEADETLEVAAVSPGAVKTVDEVLLLVLANEEHSEHLDLTLTTVVRWLRSSPRVDFHLKMTMSGVLCHCTHLSTIQNYYLVLNTSTPFDRTKAWVRTTCLKLLIKVCFTASNIFGSEILVE